MKTETRITLRRTAMAGVVLLGYLGLQLARVYQYRILSGLLGPTIGYGALRVWHPALMFLALVGFPALLGILLWRWFRRLPLPAWGLPAFLLFSAGTLVLYYFALSAEVWIQHTVVPFPRGVRAGMWGTSQVAQRLLPFAPLVAGVAWLWSRAKLPPR